MVRHQFYFLKFSNKLSDRLKLFHAFHRLDLLQLSSSVQHLCSLTSWVRQLWSIRSNNLTPGHIIGVFAQSRTLIYYHFSWTRMSAHVFWKFGLSQTNTKSAFFFFQMPTNNTHCSFNWCSLAFVFPAQTRPDSVSWRTRPKLPRRASGAREAACTPCATSSTPSRIHATLSIPSTRSPSMVISLGSNTPSYLFPLAAHSSGLISPTSLRL